MAVQNATAVTLSVAGEVMAHATSASFSISRDLRDSTTKSSLGWQENLAGLMSWEMSGDAFVDIAATDASMADCFTLLTTGVAVAVVFTVGTAGDTYSGEAFVTSISSDAGIEENATFSLSLTGTKDLEQIEA
jgi:TP901-1 family phage major tail protein